MGVVFRHRDTERREDRERDREEGYVEINGWFHPPSARLYLKKWNISGVTIRVEVQGGRGQETGRNIRSTVQQLNI